MSEGNEKVKSLSCIEWFKTKGPSSHEKEKMTRIS